jgi:site-specific recombinase XerD
MSRTQLDYLSSSFELHLRAENKSPKTIGIYLAALRKFAGWMADAHPELDDWVAVDRNHLREWSADTIQRTSPGNASVQWRGLQQFLKWAVLEGEIPHSPMQSLSGPQVVAPLVPVIEVEQIRALLAVMSGTSFVDRRDQAIIRLLIDTGIRKGELVGLKTEDVNVLERDALVTGKGSRSRIVRFGAKTAKAIDRYLRMRSRRPDSESPSLWLSARAHHPITYHGMAVIIRRRARQAGLEHLHPHQFRHTFAHLWLDQGGAEGDLMELAGWTSRQMLTRYGASARSARARRSYDRIELGDRFQVPSAALRRRRTWADFEANAAKYAFLACSARRKRSIRGSSMSGSTWRSKRSMKASRALDVRAAGSVVWDQDRCAAARPFRLRTLLDATSTSMIVCDLATHRAG